MTEDILDNECGMVTNIFDIGAVGVRHDMYKAWVVPDLYPNEPQPVLKNWHPEDLAAFCGGEYTQRKEYA